LATVLSDIGSDVFRYGVLGSYQGSQVVDLKSSHGGYAGKSLAEKMRDKTDEMYDQWMKDDLSDDDATIWQGRVEGACELMAILTGTKSDLQWDSTEARYEDRKRRNG
jgi:hypothetical protein